MRYNRRLRECNFLYSKQLACYCEGAPINWCRYLARFRYNSIKPPCHSKAILSIAMQRAVRLQFHFTVQPVATLEIQGHCLHYSNPPLSLLSFHTYLTAHSLILFPSTSTFPALNSNVMQHPTLVIQTAVLKSASLGLSTLIYTTV